MGSWAMERYPGPELVVVPGFAPVFVTSPRVCVRCEQEFGLPADAYVKLRDRRFKRRALENAVMRATELAAEVERLWEDQITSPCQAPGPFVHA
jgi:hypothetical protein